MKSLGVTACCVALAFATACDKEQPKEDTVAEQTAAESETKTASGTVDEDDGADEAIPTVEDFEEEARAEITEANLEAELDKLEKEITEE